MKIPRIRLFPLFLLTSCMWPAVHAATVMHRTANRLELHFTLVPAITPLGPTPLSRWTLRFGSDRFDLGESLRYRLLENTEADWPILDKFFDGTIALNGSIATFGNNFQDRQGLLVIDVYAGSVTIDRVFVETYINGERFLYQETLGVTLIPEPSISILVMLGTSSLLLKRNISRRKILL